MKPSFEKGDVVLIDLGTVDKGIIGHELAKTRPCIIINSFDHFGIAIVVPVSTKPLKFQIYSQVGLNAGDGGLQADSYVLCHQIRAISHKRIVHGIGKLNATQILRIQGVLIDVLGL